MLDGGEAAIKVACSASVVSMLGDVGLVSKEEGVAAGGGPAGSLNILFLPVTYKTVLLNSVILNGPWLKRK